MRNAGRTILTAGAMILATLGGCAAPTASRTAEAGPSEHAPLRAQALDAPSDRTSQPTPPPPAQGWERIGTSTQGRPIEATTIGAGGGIAPRVLLVGGIHGDEPEGGRTIDAIEAYLRVLRPGATVRIVRDVNPDGTASNARHSANDIDLNRNWPAANFRPGSSRGPAPLSEPETRALHDELERFDPDAVLVVHSSSRGPFVNYDGPAAELATVFASAAAASDRRWRVVPDMGYATPGSLGSYVGIDRGVPILTLEFDRGHEADAAWIAMRDGVRAVIEHVRLAR
ncbi:MAG: M14 family zinc carboxypeptidase [Phycisphaerales bacterium JB054]